MPFEGFDFADHRGIDNNFTRTFSWTQIRIMLCKRPNKIHLKNDVDAPGSNQKDQKKRGVP